MFVKKMKLTAKFGATACAVACAAAVSMPAMAFADTAASKQAEADAQLQALNIILVELDQAAADYQAAVVAQEQAEQNVADAQAIIDAKTAEIETNQAKLGTRACSMYRSGSSSFLDVLLGSTSFEEFSTNWDTLNKLNASDAKMVADTKAAREEVEQAKVVLEEEAAAAQQYSEEAEALQSDLAAQAMSAQATYEALSYEAQVLFEQEQEAARRAEEERLAAIAAEEAARQQALLEAAAAAADEGAIFYDDSGAEVTIDSGSIEYYDEATGTVTMDDGSTVTASYDSGSNDTGSYDTGGGESAASYDTSTGNAIVDRARSAMGSAYVWGGVGGSDGGYDCSGLVSYAISGSNTRLGTTHTFMGWNQVSDPQPGDVCVNEGHTGIYVGDGQMIHAADYGIGVIQGEVQDGMIYVRP